jgi:hypothetical protein
MRRLFKALAVLGMLLCFTLGAFAVSFAAHQSPSTWPRFTLELHRLPTSNATQLTKYVFRFGVGSESGTIPNSPRLDLEEIRPAHSEFAEPVHAPLLTRIHTPKVSLQILELVLLL